MMSPWETNAIRAVLFMFCLSWLATGWGQSVKQIEQQLTQVRQHSQRLQTVLSKQHAIQKTAEQGLSGVDDRLSRTLADLLQIQTKIALTNEKIDALKQTIEPIFERLRTSKKRLAKLFQFAYQSQFNHQIRLLLPPQSLRYGARRQHLYRYVLQQRNQRIDTLNKTLQDYHKTLALLNQQRQQHQQLQANLTQKKREFYQFKRNYRQRLSEIKQTITQQSSQLKASKKKENHAIVLIEKLQQSLMDVTEDLPPAQTFEQAKASLLWPVQGRLQHRFNSALKQRDGLRIITTEPTVRATFRGRVVYAERLRGLGLLLILDHGDGYASLYGQNQILYKNVGEWVEQGDKIASAERLYFGLRLHGEPINPHAWLNPKKKI